MGSPSTPYYQSRLNWTTSDPPSTPSSWKSKPPQRKSPADTPLTQYSSLSASPPDYRLNSRQPSIDLPSRSIQQPKRKSSVFSLSLLRSKSHSEPLSAPEESIPKVKRDQKSKSRLPWKTSNRSASESDNSKVRISPPIPPRPEPLFHQNLFESDTQLQGKSEPKVELGRQLDSQSSFGQRPHHKSGANGKLADFDPDKRGVAFARIHPEGWGKIIPKHWVEDEFSDDEEEAGEIRSVYSQDNGEEPAIWQRIVAASDFRECNRQGKDLPSPLWHPAPNKDVKQNKARYLNRKRSSSNTSSTTPFPSDPVRDRMSPARPSEITPSLAPVGYDEAATPHPSKSFSNARPTLRELLQKPYVEDGPNQQQPKRVRHQPRYEFEHSVSDDEDSAQMKQTHLKSVGNKKRETRWSVNSWLDCDQNSLLPPPLKPRREKKIAETTEALITQATRVGRNSSNSARVSADMGSWGDEAEEEEEEAAADVQMQSRWSSWSSVVCGNDGSEKVFSKTVGQDLISQQQLWWRQYDGHGQDNDVELEPLSMTADLDDLLDMYLHSEIHDDTPHSAIAGARHVFETYPSPTAETRQGWTSQRMGPRRCPEPHPHNHNPLTPSTTPSSSSSFPSAHRESPDNSSACRISSPSDQGTHTSRPHADRRNPCPEPPYGHGRARAGTRRSSAGSTSAVVTVLDEQGRTWI